MNICKFVRMTLFLCAAIVGAGVPVAGPVVAQGTLQGRLDAVYGSPGKPLEVQVAIWIDQISFVDQKAENFGAVAIIRATWRDPALAFDPAEYGRDIKVFRPADFQEFARNIPTIVPVFVVRNQQSNRWIHQSALSVAPDGEVGYFEKSSLTLQAPYFDFTKYPFDTQRFQFEIASVYPSDTVTYTVNEAQSGLGDLLGEEEWILEDARMTKSQVTGLSGLESDQVALVFDGRRHVTYYVIRVFLPMLVLITVGWALFFLDEYRKRIEIAGANLLVFVAFNWAISDNLPKLGYITFLDFILQLMFLATGAIIVFNVVLRKLKVTGREDLARKLDNYVIKWIYPLGYAAIVGFAVMNYLVVG